jgi:hypothetical protein
VEAGGQRLLCSLQQVVDALAGQFAEQVFVARRAAPLFGLLGLILILDPQIGVLAQLAAHLRRGEEMELDTGAGRAIGVERNQHFRHPLVGPRLRHQFEHDAHAVAVHKNLLGGEIARVGQPVGELFGRCVRRLAEGKARRMGVVALAVKWGSLWAVFILTSLRRVGAGPGQRRALQHR